MRRALFFLCFPLAACDMAGAGFGDVEPVRVVEEGSHFTLRRKGDFVEAVRTSPEMLPRFQQVAPKAGIAVQRLTGCRADWVVGDPAKMVIGLECHGRRAPPLPPARHMVFCDFIDAGQNRLSMECQRG